MLLSAVCCLGDVGAIAIQSSSRPITASDYPRMLTKLELDRQNQIHKETLKTYRRRQGLDSPYQAGNFLQDLSMEGKDGKQVQAAKDAGQKLVQDEIDQAAKDKKKANGGHWSDFLPFNHTPNTTTTTTAPETSKTSEEERSPWVADWEEDVIERTEAEVKELMQKFPDWDVALFDTDRENVQWERNGPEVENSGHWSKGPNERTGGLTIVPAAHSPGDSPKPAINKIMSGTETNTQSVNDSDSVSYASAKENVDLGSYKSAKEEMLDSDEAANEEEAAVVVSSAPAQKKVTKSFGQKLREKLFFLRFLNLIVASTNVFQIMVRVMMARLMMAGTRTL